MFKSSQGFLKDLPLKGCYPTKMGLASASPSNRGSTRHIASHRDRSIVFQETLLDALQKNPLNFQESDILPLFLKYRRNRQILIDLVSFLTYVLRLPTQIYLRRLRNSKFVPKDLGDRALWFKATKIDPPKT